MFQVFNVLNNSKKYIMKNAIDQYLEPLDKIAQKPDLERVDYFLQIPRVLFLSPSDIDSLNKLKEKYLSDLEEWNRYMLSRLEDKEEDKFLFLYSCPEISIESFDWVYYKLHKIPIKQWINEQNAYLKLEARKMKLKTPQARQ